MEERIKVSPLQPIRIALIDGKQVRYDFCGDEYPSEFYKDFTYIGKGKIYSLNGVMQNFPEHYHFWNRPETQNSES